MKVNNTLYLVAYPLHAMTSWCPWHSNIIRIWISYFQVVLQAILKLFAFEWSSMGIGGGARFSCKSCWYSTEHFWLNGFMSSRAQGIKWASNYRAALRYAVAMDESLQGLFLLNNFSIGISGTMSTCYKWFSQNVNTLMKEWTQTSENSPSLTVWIIYHRLSERLVNCDIQP